MYLKQIDLVGFKSFTERTKIALEPGVSCIVGPNGSGKSNISDALRWVLGEQSSRSLRGGKMEDVIFAGSKKRKALGMAEVSITLDNSDGHINLPFTDIVVTRRTFRSGQSEYLINNKQCRLKDITTMFLDTGIGVDGLSIIGQGQINTLISARPDELRSFVEEAAGIIKYRNRKRESLRKLIETQDHLDRLWDIISELDSRLEPLRLQSEKAKSYLDLTAEGDNLEIGLSLRILSEAGDRLDKLNSQFEEANRSAIEKETQRLTLEAQSEELRQFLNSLDSEVAALQESFFQAQNEREKSNSQIKLFMAQKENYEKELERLKADLAELDVNETSLRKEEESLTGQAEILRCEIAAKEQKLLEDEGDEETRRQAALLLEEKLAGLKDRAFELANELAEYRNRLRYLQQILDNNQGASARLEKQKSQFDQSLEDLRGKEGSAAEALEEHKSALQEARRELSVFQAQQEESQKNIQALAEAETACRYQAQALRTRITMLEEMSQSGEGYFPGVRSILQGLKNKEPELNGVIDVMARLIDVPEAYIAAIETYLGASIQNIVTRDEKSAKSAVKYLKDTQGGRATFLPLDIIRVREKGDFSKVLNEKGIIGRASQLVECPDRIRPAVDFLLNNLLVAENMEAASKAAKALNYRFSVVTLEGDMLNPGASITGGSRKHKGNDLLSKKLQIKNGKEELVILETRLAKAEKALTEAREEARLAEEKSAVASGLLMAQSEEIHALDSQLQQLLLEKEMTAKQIAGVTREILDLQIQDNETLNLIEELNGDLSEKEAGYAEVNAQVAEIHQELALRNNNLDEDREDIVRYKVELARSQQSLIALEENIAKAGQSKEDMLWEKEEKTADIELAEKKSAKLSGELAQEEQRFSALGRAVIEGEEKLNGKRHGFTVESERLQELEKTARAIFKEAEEFKAKAHEIEVKVARLEAEWQNEEQKLEEKFQMSFEEAKTAWEDNGMSKTAMSSRLNQLKREVNALGSVNVGAIEEYGQVSERYQFLNGQCLDLKDAKASLEKVIAEMDTIMSSRFKEAYHRFSEEFNIAFARLFNGGEAALSLTDPANILETGVELVVQLPGKKVSNYNLLSGGEKALCGIALMFAILAVRPTPFCVMDEVDAALDEANIGRFGEYLRELSGDTQFVMISHRQGTMEIASSLWGVTMEEEGISKLISVKLNKSGQTSIAS